LSKQHKNRISIRFVKIFLSYVFVVVILMTIMSSTLYGKIISVLEHEVETYNLNLLDKMTEQLEKEIIQMQNIAITITTNNSFSTFMLKNDAYDMANSINFLRDLKFTHPYIYDIALYYFIVPDKLFTTKGINNLDTFFDFSYKYENWSKEEFLSSMSGINMPVMRSVEKINNDLYMTYLYPLPLKASKPNMVIMFIVNYSEMDKQVRDTLKAYNGTYFILDENDRLIASSTAQDRIEPVELLKGVDIPSLDNAVSKVEILGKEYTVIKYTSGFNYWTHVTVIPTEQFMSIVDNSLRSLKIGTGIIFILGLGMALVFASQNYKPLKRILSSLRQIALTKQVPVLGDEFEYITRIIDKVTSENSGLQNMLSSAKNSLKENILLALLQGKHLKDGEFNKLIEGSEIDFSRPYFSVMTFLIDNYKNFIKENSKNVQELVLLGIINAIEELSLEVGCAYATDLINGTGIVLIVNLDAGKNNIDNLKDIAVRAKDLFMKKFDISLTVGIGEIFDNISMINTSFVQAEHAASCRFLQGRGKVFLSDVLNGSNEENLSYYLDKQSQLVSEVKKTNIQGVETVLSEIVSQIKSCALSIETTRVVCAGLVNTVSKIIYELSVDFSNVSSLKIKGLAVKNFETIDEFTDCIMKICSNICRHIENQKSSRKSDLINEILEYVDKNYFDSNLSLKVIGEEFNISPSYITNYFKKHIGYSLMNYIDIIRMEKVKELLKTTDNSIKDIRQQAGYIDEANFLRKFKHKEGMTPSQYRNICGRKSV